MIDFLRSLVEKEQYIVLSIWTGIIATLFIAALLFAYKVVAFIASRIKVKSAKVKLPGGSEIELGGNGGNVQQSSSKERDLQSFIFTVQQIINFSVENGNKASLKRQQLYDSQMRYIKDKFDGISIAIEYDYIELTKRSHQATSLLISYCINSAVVSKLDHICRMDKLVERTKERLLDEQRSLINGGYIYIVNELKKYVNADDSKDMQKAFEKRKDEINKSIVECLEYCWEEANKYFEELQELQSQLNDNVLKALKSYLAEGQFDQMPETWYDKSKLPPNEVVGASL